MIMGENLFNPIEEGNLQNEKLNKSAFLATVSQILRQL
jgi:hypothetical protein